MKTLTYYDMSEDTMVELAGVTVANLNAEVIYRLEKQAKEISNLHAGLLAIIKRKDIPDNVRFKMEQILLKSRT